MAVYKNDLKNHFKKNNFTLTYVFKGRVRNQRTFLCLRYKY